MKSIDSLFSSELQHGEKILWSGQGVWKMFNRNDIFLVPFSLLWTGMVFAINVQSITHPTMSAQGFNIVGVVFGIIGLYFVFGRFFYKRLRQKNTYYALTNQRALIIEKVPRMSADVDSVTLSNVPRIIKSIRKDGVGTVQFGTSSIRTMGFENTGLEFFGVTRGAIAPAFYDIPEAEKVYALATKHQ